MENISAEKNVGKKYILFYLFHFFYFVYLFYIQPVTAIGFLMGLAGRPQTVSGSGKCLLWRHLAWLMLPSGAYLY